MRPRGEIAGLLWDALEFARNVQVALGDTPLESYLDGGPVTWATERQLELIGESLGKLRRADPDLADRIPNLHQIIAMRNVLIHGYLVVNSRVVWLAATRSVPELIPVLENLRREIENDPAGSPP